MANIAATEPIPSTSVRIAATVNTGVRFNDLSAYRSEVAMIDNNRMSVVHRPREASASRSKCVADRGHLTPLAMPRAHLQPSAMVDSSGAPSTDAGTTSPAISLLAEWIAADADAKNLIGWASLDPTENEPSLFWSYVTTTTSSMPRPSGAPKAGSRATL